MDKDFYKSPWDNAMLVNGKWFPAIPLPFFGWRKQCECGHKFWRLAAYQRHWQIEHSTLGYVYWEPDGSGNAY
jgi:hypothetical protein